MRSAALLTLTAVSGVSAWGSLGHETVAYIASHYVQSHTKSWAQAILGDTSTSYLANVATWADSYRYTTAGKFSAPFHFIDAEDNPPSSCSVDYSRDCGPGGCSVSAIANYTQRVQAVNSLPSSEITTALKFLVHFLGDITQPLHDEAYEVGGNDVGVTFDGTSTNLHHTWDTNMPEQYIGGYSLSDAQSWANTIVQEMTSGQYEYKKSSWLKGLNVSDPIGSAMLWAQDANTYVCSTVMPDGATVLENEDLYPDYYNSVMPTIELQIAKGGYRLAKWLDAIAATQTVAKRSFGENEKRDAMSDIDLTGQDLLPQGVVMSRHQMIRAEMGYQCNHAH